MSFNEKYREATQYADQQNYEEAVKKLKLLLDSTKDDLEKSVCLTTIGKILGMQALSTIAGNDRITTGHAPKISFNNELFNESIKYFDKAIEVKPDSSFAYENKALTLSRKGDYEGAIKHGLTSVELNPSNLNVIANIVLWYNELEKFSEAIEYSKNILNQTEKIIQQYAENPNPINTSKMRTITGTLLNKAIAQLNLKDKTCLVVIKNAIDISEKYNLGQTDDFEKLRDMMMMKFQI
jgi:tetratricopeptide (TPR) repeat protein